MTEETYRRLMLKHTAQQTNLLFGLFGMHAPQDENYELFGKILETLQNETGEALKEKADDGPIQNYPHPMSGVPFTL